VVAVILIILAAGCGSKNEVEAFSLELEIESIYTTNTQEHHNSSLCAFCMSRLEVMWYERLTGTPGLLTVTVYGVWLEHWVVSQLPGVHG
jgi:hypothetical protein